MMQRQNPVILTPARRPPPRHAVPELSSLGQLIMASLTSSLAPPPQPPSPPKQSQPPIRVDPDSYYREVYMRQFQAEPAPQPGYTQQYFSQTQADWDHIGCDTSLGHLPHASVGTITEGMTSAFNTSVFGPNAREENEEDPDPLQQDLAALSNMDFEHWDCGGTEGNYSASRNHVPAQDWGHLVSQTALPSLQNKMNDRTRLAPRVANRVSFSEDICVPTPQDEIVRKQMKFCNPLTSVLAGSNTPPAGMVDPNELAAIEPHLFDLSLSPIQDISPREENIGIPQAQSNSSTNLPTGVASYPRTIYETCNRISSSDQESSKTVQVAVDAGIIKSAVSCPHPLQNQQNVFLGEDETVIHNKETADNSDLMINFTRNKVISGPSSSDTLYTDSHRSHIEERNDKLLNTIGENTKSFVENTELPLRDHNDMNLDTDVLSAAAAGVFHEGAVDAGRKGKTPTDMEQLDPDLSVDPPTTERVNNLNAATGVTVEHEGKNAEVKSPKIDLEAQEAWNESVDMIDISADVTLLNKTKECMNKECTRGKGLDSEFKVPLAMNESIDIFNISSDGITLQPKSRDGRKEEKACENILNNHGTPHKATTNPQIFSDPEEHDRTREGAQTPKKPTFRAPYKVVPESPIIGYPPDRRNITSTPKESQQKKVLRFGSGYSSDSSDTNDGTKHDNCYKAKNLTAKTNTEARELASDCQDLVKRKFEWKSKFMSRLSAFKFSVNNMKKTQNGEQSCCIEKNSSENAKQLSFRSKFSMQKSSGCSPSSTVKPNITKATATMNAGSYAKTNDKSTNRFTDEPESGKSDNMQKINRSAAQPKEPGNTDDSGGACYRTVDKYTRLNRVKAVDVESEVISGPNEGCSSHKRSEAGGKADIPATKHSRSAKSSGKRKSENQAHTTTMKKKKMKMTKDHSHGQADKNGKKAKKKKSKSVSKAASDNLPASKNKGARKCSGDDPVEGRDDTWEHDRGKSKSVKKHVYNKDCSQNTVDLSQVVPVQHPLGNEAQLLAVSDHLASAQEFCLTLLYRDSSSQLRERVSGGRKQHPGSGQVTGFALRITWATDSAPPLALLPSGQDGELSGCGVESFSQECAGNKTSYPSNNTSAVYKVSLGINFNKEEIRSVVSCIMKSEVRKIGFDAQESITFLVEKLGIDHREVISSWVILDPKIGGWLLDSDHPPVTFQQTAAALKVPLSQTGTGLHPEEEIRSDLETLSIVAAALHVHLVHLNLWTIFLHLEMRITPILAVMELRDIRVDRTILKQMGQRLKLKIEEVERRCHQVSGSVFNVASHAQLRTVLYQELKLDVKAKVTVPRTTKGQKSTCEAALGRLGDYHPLPGLVLQHRLLNKLKTTYVDGILACLHGSSVRAAWEQTSASTGRIQCHHPNLQNIAKQPVTVEVDGSEMVVSARECFCSREGHVLVSADFQQTELRVLAHLSQDVVLLEGFRQPSHNNTDIFKQLSATWLNKAVSDVTSYDRERTKRVVYAVMYGAGREKLSEVLHIKQSEAHDIISSFMKHFPGIPSYMRSVTELCRQQGFLTTIFRRRRSFPGIASHDTTVKSQAERQAINFIIQGSAADLSKAAMVQTEAALARCPEIDAKLLIHIHDELVWEVRTEHTQPFCDMVGHIMEDTQQLCGPLVQLTVPLPVTVSTGTSWAHMQPRDSTRSNEAAGIASTILP